MRIGIVADIHDDVESLTAALAHLRSRGAERIVSLGDVSDGIGPPDRARRVVGLLRDAGAAGVWGNHDFGLAGVIGEPLLSWIGADALDYLAGIQPHLVLEGCRFSHVEPWLDANKVEDLWNWAGPPDTPEKAALSFAAAPERFLFVGHFHDWLAMTPRRRLEWRGEGPLPLDGESRALIAVSAVVEGWCALFDTDTAVLTPLHCVP